MIHELLRMKQSRRALHDGALHQGDQGRNASDNPSKHTALETRDVDTAGTRTPACTGNAGPAQKAHYC
jgi:hypothetical protein